MASDIDRRRQEIKEKILKKSRKKSSVYLGIALIIVVFAFLLFSSLNYGEQNVKNGKPQVATGEVSKKVEESASNKKEVQGEEEKKTETLETKAELKPPEGFNESKLVKISIVDDSQSVFWSNLWPTSVYFEDSSDRVSGGDSLKIEFFRERPGWAFADKSL